MPEPTRETRCRHCVLLDWRRQHFLRVRHVGRIHNCRPSGNITPPCGSGSAWEEYRRDAGDEGGT